MSRSLDERHNHLPPAAASGYLHRVVGATLSRRGFDGAEAGALSEMERLLELHVQHLFSTAHDYAHLSGRSQPNARDLLAAQEASGWDVGTLRKESKRKRTGYTLALEDEPPEPVPVPNLSSIPLSQGDAKPQLQKAPEYAWDGAPPLPEPWTYKPDLPPPKPLPALQVTAGVLEFMKLTATERGDIPAELGLVDYKRADTREMRRRWSVKGVSA